MFMIYIIYLNLFKIIQHIELPKILFFVTIIPLSFFSCQIDEQFKTFYIVF